MLTHAHEDHIGALPFLLRELDVPVYGTRLTLGFVREKLKEHGLEDSAQLDRASPATSWSSAASGWSSSA